MAGGSRAGAARTGRWGGGGQSCKQFYSFSSSVSQFAPGRGDNPSGDAGRIWQGCFAAGPRRGGAMRVRPARAAPCAQRAGPCTAVRGVRGPVLMPCRAAVRGWGRAWGAGRGAGCSDWTQRTRPAAPATPRAPKYTGHDPRMRPMPCVGYGPDIPVTCHVPQIWQRRGHDPGLGGFVGHDTPPGYSGQAVCSEMTRNLRPQAALDPEAAAQVMGAGAPEAEPQRVSLRRLGSARAAGPRELRFRARSSPAAPPRCPRLTRCDAASQGVSGVVPRRVAGAVFRRIDAASRRGVVRRCTAYL